MQPISASDYRDLVGVSDPHLSPDGERVAFVRSVPKSSTEYERTVYVVRTDGADDSGEPRRFTSAAGVDSEPRWSPDGTNLAFTSTRSERNEPQLYVLPADGGEARQVTDVVGGVAAIEWCPDGSKLAFTQSTTPAERADDLDLEVEEDEYEREPPDPRVIDRSIYRAGTQYFDGRHDGVYTIDLADDTVSRVSENDEYDYVSPTWGDADTLYYAAKRAEDPDDSTVFDVIAHDLASDETDVLTQTSGWEVVLAAGARKVAFTYTPGERLTLRQTDVQVYDRETETTHTLTADLDRTIEAPLRWGPDEREIYFRTPDEGQVALRAAAIENTDGRERVRTVLESGEITSFDVGSEVVFTRSEWNDPSDLFAVERGREGPETGSATTAEPRRLTDVNAALFSDRVIGEPEELRFESEDGIEIQGWLLCPPTDEALDGDASDGSAETDTYPLVVEIHGGPHAMWSTAGSMFHEFQTLAARGYAVFWCNPRGSVGYGEDFQSAIEADWGAVTARDVLAGADAVCERPEVDPANQFVTGGSFGGYMTAWLVGHTDRFRGAVTQRGVYDLASFFGSTDAFKLVEWDFGTTPWDDPEFLWERSPIAYAGNATTPTLVMHAERDYRVPVNNGEMLYLFLRRNGVETRLVRYPREGHELSRSGEPGHVVDRVARLVRWFDGYSDHHDVPKSLDRGDDGLPVDDEE